jgi:hypothetical protein
VSSDPTRAPEIEALLPEQRIFPPDPGFAARANATAALYKEADAAVVDTIREHSGRAED